MKKAKRICFLIALVILGGLYLFTSALIAFQIFLFCDTNIKWMIDRAPWSATIIAIVFFALAYIVIRCGIYMDDTYRLSTGKNGISKLSIFALIFSGFLGTILCVLLAIIGLKLEVGYELPTLLGYLDGYVFLWSIRNGLFIKCGLIKGFFV